MGEDNGIDGARRATAEGSGDGEFSYPGDVTIDDSGNVCVADDGNGRVQKFAPAGGPIGPVVAALPGGAALPPGTNNDANGNGRADFADVVLYFSQMTWIAANEPLEAFDCNGNGRIDFADVVWLLNNF